MDRDTDSSIRKLITTLTSQMCMIIAENFTHFKNAFNQRNSKLITWKNHNSKLS